MNREIIKEKHKIDFGKSSAYLRYDMRSVISLLENGIDVFECVVIPEDALFDVFCAGMERYLEEIEKDNKKRVSLAKRIYKSLSKHSSIDEINKARILALPRPIIGSRTQGSGGRVDYMQLRAIYCDIIGRPENDFLTSTIREIMDRWDAYAVIKGYKKTPSEFRLVHER